MAHELEIIDNTTQLFELYIVYKTTTKDPETFDELDKEWEEAPAFGNDEADCNSCSAYQKSSDDSQNLFSGDIQ